MEVIKPFWTFYNLFDRMKTNNEKCPHILSRLEALQELVAFVQLKEPDQLPDDVSKALKKLTAILVEAKEVLEKFNKQQVMTQVMKSSDYKLQFDNLSQTLTDAFVTLSGSLHVHQEKKMAELETKLAEREREHVKHEKKLAEQENVLAEQENKSHEQEKKLARQERKLAEQEDKLAEQEDILQRVQSKLMYDSRGFYCILQ